MTASTYLNNIDYTKLYAIEDFFMKMRHVPNLRSFVGVRESSEQAEAYFEDMNAALAEMYRVCKPGAHVAIVIGNAWTGREIETDFIISHLASEAGFEVERIFVLNKRFALENRTEKKGILRESLIILKKK
jgi:DNA modification methylase